MAVLERAGGVDVHYERWGDAGAPAVLLLHGFTADLRSWAQHVEALAEDYHVVAMDLRGHGLTTAPEEDAAYMIEAYAEDVEALADHLGFELFALCGSSFGGMVALEFAVRWPRRLAALVLSDTSGAYEDSRYEEAYWQRERAIAAHEETVRKVGTGGLGRQLAASIEDEFLRDAMVRRYARLSAEGFLGTARVRRERRNLLPLLREGLTMPVLVISGEDDPVRSASRVLAAEIPGARSASFRGAGHTVPLHRPEAFLDAVIGFLRDVEDGKAIAGSVVF